MLTGIIQKITGKPYGEFLKEEIFEPCRMVDTTFEPNEEQWARLITMHNKQDGQNVLGETCDGCVFENYPNHNFLGGAGLISSAQDYLNFAQMLLNGGTFAGKRVISETSVAEISKQQVFLSPQEWWGLGVRVITDDQECALPVGTYGWSGAYGSHFWIDPTNQIVGVYMKNSRYDGGAWCVTSLNFEKDVYTCLS